MCERYILETPFSELVRLYRLTGGDSLPNIAPRYNVAPTQSMPVIRSADGGRELVSMRWGLLPSWAKEIKLGYMMINARAETVTSRPSFRDGFRRRRCLVPADGFYEWHTENGVRQPYLITVGDSEPFAMAGLWARWIATEDGGGVAKGDTVLSYAIITTSANDKISQLHHRMPVILEAGDWDAWLEGPADTGLLKSLRADRTEFRKVSKDVNNARNDVPELIEAV